MVTQSPETKISEGESSPGQRVRGPRTPFAQIIRELKWPLLVAVGVGSGLLWVLLLIQGSYLQFLAGLLPVTGGIFVGRRAKEHTTAHAIALSVITAAAAAVATAVLLNFVTDIDPLVRQALATSFLLLIPFPAFGVITSARSEQRARDLRESQSKRGGKLEKPGRVKTIDDLQALSLNQLGGYVADLWRRHGFLVDDFQFDNKENFIEFNMRKDDESWVLRVTVEEKVKQGAALQFHQYLRSQGVARGVLVTSMDFQEQAVRWAKEKPLALIDGQTLLSMDD